MDRDCINLWRKTLKSQIFRNESMLKVWIWCLLKAADKKRWGQIVVGKHKIEVELLPGQFIFGRDSAAQELDMPASSVWQRMQKLKNIGNLDINCDSNYSIISLLNWSAYQDVENEYDSNYDSRMTAIIEGQQPKKRDDNKVASLACTKGDFEYFWEAYPKKVSKGHARKTWDRLKKSKSLPPVEKILESIAKQKVSEAWTKDGGQYIPNPATWLNGERWLDEVKLHTQKYSTPSNYVPREHIPPIHEEP